MKKRTSVILIGLTALIVLALVVFNSIYHSALRPLSQNQQVQIFTVKEGSTAQQIGSDLEEQKLIRSAWAFQFYIRTRNLNNKLQAGTYALSPSQGTKAIVSTLTKGKVATRLVTILPEKRIDQIEADLINDGFDPIAVKEALNPALYADVPVLAFMPEDVNSLEGLLWPESYQKGPDTRPETIIRASLIAMGEQLTPEIQSRITAQGLSVYEGIKLASIVANEVSKPTDQAQAAQVFYKRLRQGMALASDATAPYGAIIAGQEPSLFYDSPYNTYKYPGLPPTPISTVTADALKAVAYPANTDWLYFVSGDDGTTHFSKTAAEHEANTAKYCTRLCNNQ